MDFGANKTPVEIIMKNLILETFILILMVGGIESHGKNLML